MKRLQPVRKTRPAPPRPTVTPELLAEIDALSRAFDEELLQSTLTDHTKSTYSSGVQNFVRWLRGEYHPGRMKLNDR